MSAGRILIVDDSAAIRKAAEQALVAAGHEVVVAVDGFEALQVVQEKTPDLVLLDFIMPRMNGYQFCQCLQNIPRLRDTPVILLSAKGDRIGGQLIRRRLVVDALTKPFTADALVTLVEHVLAKRRAGPPTEPATARVDEAAARVVAERAEAAGRAAQRVADVALTVLAAEGLIAPGLDRQEGLRRRLVERLSQEDLAALAADLRVLTSGQHAEAVLEGDLGCIALGEVLQLLELQRQTGTLEIAHDGGLVIVSFFDGAIELAQMREEPGDLLLGRDSAEDLDAAALRRSSEILYEALRWHDGDFRFLAGHRRPEAAASGLRIPTSSILLEGFRRVDEWRLMEGVVGDFDAIFVRDDTAADEVANLSPEEASVLACIDGQRTIREVIERTHAGAFDTCRVLYGLASARIVRRRARAA